MKYPAVLATFLAIFGPVFIGFSSASAQEEDQIPTVSILTTISIDPPYLFPMPGSRELIFYLEGNDDLSEESWTTIAIKIGNGEWIPFINGIEVQEIKGGVRLSFNDDPTAKFIRLRADANESSLSNEGLAARFLKQATFGPTIEEIDELSDSDLNFAGWIDDQMALAPGYHLDHYYTFDLLNHIDPRGDDVRAQYLGGPATLKVTVWWDKALLGEDQLRQRMAWALSQIFVMGEAGSKANQYPIQWMNWYDILIRNSFGNFRELLQEVTLNPKMGDYLTYWNNQKANGAQLPDENYAREVMQLFTIGLWMLNNDGTLQLDEQGEPIPTYTNYHITELAKVFTGLVRSANQPDKYWNPNRVTPMRENNNRHDKTAKEMFDGTIIPAGRDTIVDITHALDVLFNHSNTPPFISHKLIQRFTSSNPSPEYIERVANVFIDNGEGERGDLAAVLRAILLDPEARDAGYMINAGRGKLREPLLKFTQLCRGFYLRPVDDPSRRDHGHFWMQAMDVEFGMSPYKYPSVFNFYYPDYVPYGEVSEVQKVGPEFQILDDSTGMKTFDVFRRLIEQGLVGGVANGLNPRPQLNYTNELALANDIPALIDRLDLLLTHDTMRDSTKEIIANALEAIPDIFPETRVETAVLLVSISPEFAILE